MKSEENVIIGKKDSLPKVGVCYRTLTTDNINSVLREKLTVARKHCYVNLYSVSFLFHEKNEVQIFDSEFFSRTLAKSRNPYNKRNFTMSRQIIKKRNCVNFQ